MTEYRCHYLIGDRVQGVKMFACHSDAEMVVHANELLNSDTQCDAVEVWTELDWWLVCREVQLRRLAELHRQERLEPAIDHGLPSNGNFDMSIFILGSAIARFSTASRWDRDL